MTKIDSVTVRKRHKLHATNTQCLADFKYQHQNISNVWSFHPEIYHYFGSHVFFLFQRKVTLSDIRSKSGERTFCGYSVPILIKCHGTECHLYGDRVKATLQSSNRTLEIYFPVSVSFKRSPIFCGVHKIILANIIIILN